jgi:hypothetical protein
VPTPEDWDRLATHLRAVASKRINELFVILDELTPDGTDPRGGSHPDALQAAATS